MKRNRFIQFFWGLTAFFFIGQPAIGQQEQEPEAYVFKPVVEVPASSVKDQYRSGTCWVFSGLSFFESELMRMGQGELDLSEMFLARHAFEHKADNYVRYHGHVSFSGGGESSDVTDMIRAYGVVPESVYNGLNYGTQQHVHSELDNVLEAMVESIVKNKNHQLSTAWKNAYSNVLDAYMGELPAIFQLADKSYTPIEYRDALGLNMDNYVEIASFSHHPFYSKFIFELPDNWANGMVYNVPLDEFIEIMDYALGQGYSLLWGSDVSEKGFSNKNGVAIIPDVDRPDLGGTEREKWEQLSAREKREQLYSFDAPLKEKEITQAIRQEGFDNWTTEDDHGMHIVGMAKDQNGTKYYHVKNSWGADVNDFGGYFYASESFVRAKSMSVMLHKDAIPAGIRQKLGL